MSPKHVLTSSDQQTSHASLLTYAPWAMDVRIYRETDEELVAQIDGLRDEARKLEPRLVRRSTPAQRAHDLKALRWRFDSLLDDELTRLAAMLCQAGIQIDAGDGQVVGVSLR